MEQNLKHQITLWLKKKKKKVNSRVGFSWTKCQMFMWNHFPSFSSDGQHAEIVAGVRGARRLPAGVLEQLRGRLPAKTGEPGEQRLNGGLGQVPRCCQALCQPHHQAEVSQVYQNYIQNERFLNSFSFSFFFFLLKQCRNFSNVWDS